MNLQVPSTRAGTKKGKKNNNHEKHKKQNKPDKLNLIRQTFSEETRKNNDYFWENLGNVYFRPFWDSFEEILDRTTIFKKQGSMSI